MDDEKFFQLAITKANDNTFQIFMTEVGGWRRCIHCSRESSFQQPNHWHYENCLMLEFIQNAARRMYAASHDKINP